MISRPKAKYSQEAKAELAARGREFSDALATIAERVATHEGHETVQVQHLERAHRLLVGPSRYAGKWWRRRDVQIGVGTTIASLGFGAFGTALAQIPPAATAEFWTWVIGVPVLLLLGGTALTVCGVFNRD